MQGIPTLHPVQLPMGPFAQQNPCSERDKRRTTAVDEALAMNLQKVIEEEGSVICQEQSGLNVSWEAAMEMILC